MTKSSVRKAAAKKARGTDRKTARKVGAGKAPSTDRKTAKAVAEKARGTSQDRRSIRGFRSRCANARVGARSRREERSSDARAL